MLASIQVTMVAGAATTPSSPAEAYRDYAQRAARWAQILGGSDIGVEDVVQDVFLVVTRKWTSYRAEGSFTSWLFEITRRVVANHRRRQWLRIWRWGGDEELERLPARGPDPAAELERRRLAALFYRALDQLPEKYRTVFVLYEIEDSSIKAISELCQLNPSTVKVQLTRARQRFARSFQKLLGRLVVAQLREGET
jgi:RNA polymerase sigma factor (sigma-70 family)